MTGPDGRPRRDHRRPGPTRPVPAVWPEDEPGLPPLDGIVPALEGFTDISDASPLEIELRLSAFLAELGAGALAPLDPGEPDHEELLNGLVEVCLHHLEHGPPRVVLDFLWVVDAFGLGYLEWPLHDRLAASTLPSSPAWVMAVGRAEVTGTYLVTHETGDHFAVAITARHPGAQLDHVVAVHIDANLDGLARDVLVHDDAEQFRRLSAEQTGAAVVEVDPATAAVLVDEAVDVTFETGELAPVTEEFRGLVSFLEHYVAKLPPGGSALPKPTPATAAEQATVVDRFLATEDGAIHAGRRELLLDAVEFVVDELGGDPLRWSPVVTQLVSVGWLPLSPHGADRPAAFGALRSFVAWAHREQGWDDRYLDDTLAVLDAASTVTGRGGLDVSQVDVLQRAVDAGVDLDDEDALDAFLDDYLDDDG